MTMTNETLMAYADGELTAEEMRSVEQEIAKRPELKSYIERQLELRNALRDAFAEVLDAPLPERLLAATAKSASWRWRMREAIRGLAARRILVLSGIPAAAALACGLLIGVLVSGSGGTDIVPVSGNLVAKGALAEALSQQLASQPLPTAYAKIGVSFRNKTGYYCRTFQTGTAAGIACHENGNWNIAALTRPESEAGGGGAYRPAASAMPDFVRQAAAGMILGAPLNADEERAARNQGWNPR